MCVPGRIGFGAVACTLRTCTLSCGHGRCNDGACECHNGFRGERCDQPDCPVTHISMLDEYVVADALDIAFPENQSGKGLVW